MAAAAAVDADGHGLREPGSAQLESGTHRSLSRTKITGAGLVISFFVVTYGYNSFSFARDALRGDQWVWVESVLIPYHRGDLSLFHAVTWEYSTLSHSHILSLGVFLFSFEFLDLSLIPDRVIGFLALAGVLYIVFRHARRSLPLDNAMLVTAVASSMVFMSSAPHNFGWSLLQLQMLYVLIAFVYLWTFSSHYLSRPLLHAMFAMSATLLLGDAIGVAAVIASLAYLGVLAVRRRAPIRALAAYFGLFPVEVLLLSAIFTGERSHASGSILDFVSYAFDSPREVFRGAYYSVATVFVALRGKGWETLLLERNRYPFWFAVTAVTAVLAILVLRRSPLRSQDCFPLLIILSSAFWTLGTMQARLEDGGAQVMQAPRYASYTTLAGVGLVLLIAPKLQFAGGLRVPLLLIGGFVVLVNGVGSYNLLDNGAWVDEQARELTNLRAYVRDETQEFHVVGGRCTRGPCLRAGYFLQDLELGAFRHEAIHPPSWERDLRDVAFERLDQLSRKDVRAVHEAARALEDRELYDWVLNDAPIELGASIDREGIEIPPAQQADAERLVVRVVRAQTGEPTDPRG